MSLGQLVDQISSATDDALEQLDHAVQTAGHLSTLGDHLVGHFVDVARASGASWAQIGQRLGGVSKQAAQQRFSVDFSRFTPRAREVITTTQSIAMDHQHTIMGTEHVLLALCRDPESLAAKTLAKLAGSLDAVRDATTARFEGLVTGKDQPRFTIKAKAALGNAAREALDLGHNYIGTEHLLLGLLSGPQLEPNVAVEVLNGLGITYQNAREDLLTQLAVLTAALAKSSGAAEAGKDE